MNPAEAAIYGMEQYAPFIAGWASGRKASKVRDIWERVKAGDPVEDFELKMLGTQMALDENWGRAGLGAQSAAIAGQSTTFMAELGGTAGLSSLVRGAAGLQKAGQAASLAGKTKEVIKLAGLQTALSGRAYQRTNELLNRESHTAQIVRDKNNRYRLKYSEVDEDSVHAGIAKRNDACHDGSA